jgi:PAS domain S-box-containing protein
MAVDENVAMEIFENGSDGVFVFDRLLRVLSWNDVMEGITGIPRDTAIGRALLELLPALVETGDDAHMAGTLEGRMSFSTDRGYRSRERGGFARRAYYLPFHGPDGSLGGIGLLRDPRTVRVPQMIRESEHRFQAMADSAPVLLWVAGPDSLCDFFNQGWLEFTGRTLEQERGLGWAEGVHFEDFQRVMDVFLASFNARAPFEMEYRLRHRTGEYRWILDRGTPRYAPDGDFVGYIGSCIDITGRRMSSDTLRKTADELARSNRELERFAYIASHDLQEPLRMVTSFTELLAARYQKDLDEDGREFVRFAADGARRMQKLLDGLLSFSRVRRPDETAFHPTDCSEVLREVLDDLRLSINEAAADLTRDPLPTVMGDPVYLGQVFRNLIERDQVGADLRDHVAASRTARTGSSVQDNGVGFDMKFSTRSSNRSGLQTPTIRGTGSGLDLQGSSISTAGGSGAQSRSRREHVYHDPGPSPPPQPRPVLPRRAAHGKGLLPSDLGCARYSLGR